MSRNIRLEIEYDGTNYCGWQKQSLTKSRRIRTKTIQATIEKALRKILREKIKLIGSSRTDSGVHAKAQVANFKTNSKIHPDKLAEGLNALLPADIAIKSAQEVPLDFHSRFSAKSKVYRYTILNSKHRRPHLRNYAYFCRYPLDIKLMKKEAAALLGRHNFSSFCASAGLLKNPLKAVTRLTISREKELIYVDIEADGYLYNMVRNIVGTLIDIGRGKLAAVTLRKILISRDRRLAGQTAPAGGLCLIKVKY